MKKLFFHLTAVFLMLAGAILLVIGAMEGQGIHMMLGAGLALLAGVVALLMQFGLFSNRTGTVLGIAFAIASLFLAYLNYREAHPDSAPRPTDRNVGDKPARNGH